MPTAGDSLIEQILRYALTSPDAVALITPDATVSFSQLAARFHAIAGQIQSELHRLPDKQSDSDLPPRIAVRYPPSDVLVLVCWVLWQATPAVCPLR